MRTIGVFDSGIGGLSVVRAIERELPDYKVIFVNDEQNVPYGDKPINRLYELVLPILQDLATKTDVIVIACNTVTTNLISRLRQDLPVPLVGMEPMIKPAVQNTKSGVIAVCATPGTLSSERYRWLKDTYAPHTGVLEPDCNNWARMIEDNDINHAAIAAQVDELCANGADVIVLGCTHYHWIEEQIKQTAGGRALVLQPETPVIDQLKKVLEQL